MAVSARLVVLACALVGVVVCAAVPSALVPEPDRAGDDDKLRLSLLVSVGEPWGDCNATVRTDFLPLNQTRENATRIMVGGCDEGPITLKRRADPGAYPQCQDVHKPCYQVTFYSSVIEDASPPVCAFNFDLAYGFPVQFGSSDGLLAGCATMDSREGYHLTSYSFFVVDWKQE